MDKEEIRKLESDQLNTGVDLSIPEPDHVWVGGENSKIIYSIVNELGDWKPNAQKDETQRPFKIDWMNCTAQGAMESIAMQVNYFIANGIIDIELLEKWLIDGIFNGSERALSISSGNTKNGNNLYNVCESIRTCGIIPETILQIPTSSISWEDYHNKALLTKEVKDWGLKFLEYFDIKFEKISTGHTSIKKHLKQAPLFVASATCYGWFTDAEIKKCSARVNHAWCIPFDDGKIRVKDSYPYYNRTLASDYLVPYVFKIVVTPKDIILKKQSMGKTLAKIGKDKNSNGISIILLQTSEAALYANLLNHNIEFKTKGQPHTVDFSSLVIDAEIEFKDGVEAVENTVTSKKTFWEKLSDLFNNN